MSFFAGVLTGLLLGIAIGFGGVVWMAYKFKALS